MLHKSAHLFKMESLREADYMTRLPIPRRTLMKAYIQWRMDILEAIGRIRSY